MATKTKSMKKNQEISFKNDLQLYPIVAQQYETMSDEIRQKKGILRSDSEQHEVEMKFAMAILPKVVAVVASLRSLELVDMTTGSIDASDFAKIYESTINLYRLDMDNNSRPLRQGLLPGLREERFTPEMREGVEEAIRRFAQRVKDLTNLDADEHAPQDLPELDPNSDPPGQLIQVLQDSFLHDASEKRYLAQLAKYWRDPDNEGMGLLRRDLILFCFCSSISCLRVSYDSETPMYAEDFAKQQALDQSFIGEPLAYHFFAIAFHNDGASVENLRLGYEYAVAARRAYPLSAGVVHNVGAYLNQLATSVTNDEERDQILHEALNSVDEAISLNPSYPSFYRTRANIKVRLYDTNGARIDVKIGETLDAETADKKDHDAWDRLRRDVEQAGDLRRPIDSFNEELRKTKASLDEMIEKNNELRKELGESLENADRNTRVMTELREDHHHARREQIQMVAFVAGAIGIITASASVAAGAGKISVGMAVALIVSIMVVVLGFLYFGAKIVATNSRTSWTGQNRREPETVAGRLEKVEETS